MQSQNKFPSEATGAGAKDERRHGMYEFDDCGSNQLEPFEPPPMREMVEVEFNKDARSGVEDWDFDKDEPSKVFPCEWQSDSDLIKILEKYKFVSWKPSFRKRYRWSHGCSEELDESYKKAGRDRFVTLKFAESAEVLKIAKELSGLPEIARAVAVPQIAPPSPPLDEPFAGTSDQVEHSCDDYGCLSKQWYLFRCGVPEAWAQGASGHGVVIAAIDWGFDLNHPDLSHTALSQNVMRNLPNVADGNLLWHGNGVLGLAGAAANGEGMAGIAHGATLWAIQAASSGLNRPVVDQDFWVEAIDFVRATPASGRKVIVLELQTADFSNPEAILTVRTAIAEAIREGIVVCVPAGNGNRFADAGVDDEGISFRGTDAIVVGATRFDPETNPIAAGTNGGDRVTVYAPGDSDVDLTCGLRGGYRDNFGGTSGATAKVAGIVALMLEVNNQLTPQQVRDILRGSRNLVLGEAENPVGVLVDANQAVSAAIALRTTAAGTRMEREAA